MYSSNPKIALEQVVVMYRNWIEANLSKCSSPFKGIGKRKHLVSVSKPSTTNSYYYHYLRLIASNAGRIFYSSSFVDLSTHRANFVKHQAIDF